MTVSELISVLSEMNGDDVVVIGHANSIPRAFSPAADSVYSALVDIGDKPWVKCVVIDHE